MDKRSQWLELLERLQAALKLDENDCETISQVLQEQEPVDIALALEELDVKDAEKVFSALDRECAAKVLGMLEPGLTTLIADKLNPGRLSGLAKLLPNRDAAALLSEQSTKTIHESADAGLVKASVAKEVTQRLLYPEGSAGRLMTTDFIRLRATMTISEALAEIRSSNPDEDLAGDMCVVEPVEDSGFSRERLVGVISIRDAVMASGDQKVQDVMEHEVVCVVATTESIAAARLLSKHKFLALPVTDEGGFLVGVIPSEELMQLTLARLYVRYSRTVGTDTAAMEQMSPAQAAKTRVPWILGTIVIELGAALMIDRFSAILTQVILLAAFMPIISAVSGNVGLQAAAITVRELDVGDMSVKAAKAALLKESATTLIMAVICGLVLAVIGGLWSRHLVFGMVIGFALTCSMMTAAFMGTLFPMLSKKLGFDPATTAGPFETAFQDVIGFGVFLGLASLFANHL